MSDKDKVHISAYYDEATNTCHSIEVTLNYDGISREDLTSAIQALFHPAALLKTTTATYRHTELGGTEVIEKTTDEPGPSPLMRAPQPVRRPDIAVNGRPLWANNGVPQAPQPTNPRRQ